MDKAITNALAALEWHVSPERVEQILRTHSPMNGLLVDITVGEELVRMWDQGFVWPDEDGLWYIDSVGYQYLRELEHERAERRPTLGA